MKVQVKKAFKSYFFVTKKVMKKQTGSAWNFLQPKIPVCRGAYIPYFKIKGRKIMQLKKLPKLNLRG